MRFSFPKQALLGIFVLLSFCCQAAQPINGAGSSAAYPIYRLWAEHLGRDGGLALNYDPVGSSAGLKKARERQVDFGATDVAPKADQLQRDGLLLFPTVITGVVPVLNLPRHDKGLVLDGPTLAGVFLGEITRWDAPEIRALNPSVNLPAKAITVVVRSDGSGSSYHFADYLAKVSPAWKQRMGVASTLKWPAGFVGAVGSKGVVEAVRTTPGAIAYVDYNYVQEARLQSVALKNAEGAVVEASPSSFDEALIASQWLVGGDFTQTLTAQPGKRSWPITMGTFVVLPRVAEHPEQARQVAKFFTDAFMRGDELAKKASFVRLPGSVQAKAFRVLSEMVDKQGRPLAVTVLR